MRQLDEPATWLNAELDPRDFQIVMEYLRDLSIEKVLIDAKGSVPVSALLDWLSALPEAWGELDRK